VIRIATFYRFVQIADPARLRNEIERSARELGLLGTVLVATEGVNGTLAGEAGALATWIETFVSDRRFAGLRPTVTRAATPPFKLLKVKVRDELVSLRASADRARTEARGVHVHAAEWNRLLDDPNVLVIDVRNRYEIEVGRFPGAVDPGTGSFHEFPAFAASLDPERPVAMCCTGGIRCEKASTYLLARAFRRVFQLDGGILRYLEEAGADNRFEGECFLFDQRVAVDASLDVGSFVTCHACRHPLSTAARTSPLFKEGERCPHCYEMLTAGQRAGFAERRRQALLAATRAAANGR
jgi:UPF0176 protein